jgi:hypothetical protein
MPQPTEITQFIFGQPLRYGDEQNPDQSHNLLGTEPIPIKSLLRDDMTNLPKARFHSKFFCTFLQITDENGFSIAAPFCITDEARPGDGMWLSKQGTREVLQFKMDIVTMIHSAALRTVQS